MLIENKAVEPTLIPTNATYRALIINVLESNETDTTTFLQIFCPDVMTCTYLSEAKLAIDNYIEVPKYSIEQTTEGEEIKKEYRYEVGGLVLVSYQDGKSNEPIFIRQIEINESIVAQNQVFINGNTIIPVENEDGNSSLYDFLFNSDLELSSEEIQNGVSLLPALEQCNYKDNNGYYLSYEYFYDDNKKRDKVVTIYRCGKYGTEFVFNKDNALNDLKYPEQYTFDYLKSNNITNNDYISALNLFSILDRDLGDNIITIFNTTIKEFEKRHKTKDSFRGFSNLNSSRYYLYTNLAGYSFVPFNLAENILKDYKESIEFQNFKEKEYDTSDAIFHGLSSTDKTITNLPLPGSPYYNIFYANSIKMSSTEDYIKNIFPVTNIYHGYYATPNLIPKDVDIEEQESLSRDFVGLIWKNIYSNKYFEQEISTFYAKTLAWYLNRFMLNYQVKDIKNKMLLVLTVVSAGFPILYPLLYSLSSDMLEQFYDKSLKADAEDFIENVLKCLRAGTKEEENKIFNNIKSNIGKFFSRFYHAVLGLKLSDIGDWDEQLKYSYPIYSGPNENEKNKIIWNQIQNCVDYIDDNYNTIVNNISITLSGKTGSVYNEDNDFQDNDTFYSSNTEVTNNINNTTNNVLDIVSNAIKKQNNNAKNDIYYAPMKDVVGGLCYDSPSPGKYYDVKITDSNGNIMNNKNNHAFQDYVFKQCKYYNISTAALMAIMETESNFRGNAKNANKENGIITSYDEGICQLNNKTYTKKWVSDFFGANSKIAINYSPYNMEYNVAVALVALTGIISVYPNNPNRTYMCYNHGVGGANDLFRAGIYKTERSIVFTENFNKYRGQIGNFYGNK